MKDGLSKKAEWRVSGGGGIMDGWEWSGGDEESTGPLTHWRRVLQLASARSFFRLGGSSGSDSELDPEPPSNADTVLPLGLV